MLQTTISTAKKAGKFLLDNFRKDFSLIKNRSLAKEISTKYDKEADKIIISEITKKFPAHGLLTEESGLIENNKLSKSEYLWIIDSLDGTSNFSLGNPFFAVSIALMKKSKLVIGVVYAPFLDELYVAEKGKGATLNGREIHVSEITELKNSYLVSCEGGDKSNKRHAQVNYLFHPEIKDMRKLGSAALEACFVASGRAEAYITFNISSWDVAASILIVEESGGKATDFSGNKWKPVQSDVVISNGILHEKILERINQIDIKTVN